MRRSSSLLACATSALLLASAGTGRADPLDSAPPEQEATPTPPPAAASGAAPQGTTTTVGGDESSGDTEGEVAATASGPTAQWGVGARVREVFMPVQVLNLFLKSASSMAQQGAGIEVTYRKGQRDLVIGVEYDNISPSDWTYLGKNDMAEDNAAWMHFDGFALLSADVSIMWNAPIVGNLDFRYGAGFGLGTTLGNMYKTLDYNSAGVGPCNESNYGDPSVCHPPEAAPGVCTSAGCNSNDPSIAGNRVLVQQPSPVYPIVNFAIGLRYRVGTHLAFNLEAGFRDVFYTGLGAGYYF